MEREKRKYNDWFCWKCNARNFERRVTCFQCNNEKKEPPPPIIPLLKNMNHYRGVKIQERRPGDWECECGEFSFAKRTHCYQCGKERPPVKVLKKQCPRCHLSDNAYSLLIECDHQVCIKCVTQIIDCPLCGVPVRESVRLFGLHDDVE